MAERENESGGSEGWALIRVDPVEQVITKDGVGVIGNMSVLASDDETADAVTEEFLQMTGGEKIGEGSGSSSVAFSSNDWHAPWQPKGPKPNWYVEPPAGDPSLN